MLVVQAPAGDRRNWQAIRSWAQALAEGLQLEARVDGERQPLAGAAVLGGGKWNGHERRKNITQASG
jgi:hypothetical protein